MSTIRLRSSDGEIFEVDVKIAKCSGTIKTLLENFGIEHGGDTVIPLPEVNEATLRKFIKWAYHHKDDLPLVPVNNDDEKNPPAVEISEWDAKFLKLDQEMLCNLASAANYLDAKPLENVLCKTIANMIKGKSADEIRKTFHFEPDVTPDQSKYY